MVRSRALLLIVLTALPIGCLGDEVEGPRLAQPTDTPVEIPGENVAPQRSGPPVDQSGRLLVNFSDPGYVVEGEWSVGDSWYYETNQSPWNFRSMTVKERRVENGRDVFVIEEKFGMIDQAAKVVLTSLVDARNYTRIRATDNEGSTIRYDPPANTIRLLRNASSSWNETGVNPRGIAWNDRHVVNSYFAGFDRIELLWGESRAARIEHRDFVTPASGERTDSTLIRWVDRTYLNDVAIQRAGSEQRFLLVGARVGGQEWGSLLVT